MSFWFSENHTDNVKLSIKVDKQIYSGVSEYQRIDIFDSYEFGKFMILDNLMMVTEKDEFIYHEMIIHTPMAVNPDIKSVLVIGGGDGGSVRELTKYKGIERIDMVEIDKLVVDVCRKYLPSIAGRLDDERVSIFYEDGLKYIRKFKDTYDLIVVDSTDAFGPGEGLFTKEFYGNCYKALTKKGILVNQNESPYYTEDAQAMSMAHNRIKKFFPYAMLYQAHIPTYPSGHWMFGFASKCSHPVNDLKEDRWNSLNIPTGYYNTDLHKGSFALPNYVYKLLESCDE